MKFSVGWQNHPGLRKSILNHTDSVREIYFPWGGFTTGRGVHEDSLVSLKQDLRTFADAGLALNWLLNGNCYGSLAQSRDFFQQIGDQTDYLLNTFALKTVTTASPLIAKFLKNNFPDLEVRASVNMEIGTPEAVEYLLPWFDGFYLKREYNYDLARLKKMRKFTLEHGKKLFLLVNSGCLNFCSARTFHDNLVAHQHEIAQQDNALDFHGVCHLFLKDNQNKKKLLAYTNFIRPEDINFYDPYCDGCKLATRVSRFPAEIVEAYTMGHWNGNLLDLTEPSHAGNCYPNIIRNDKIPRDYHLHRLQCDKNCQSCSYCCEVQETAACNLKGLYTDVVF